MRFGIQGLRERHDSFCNKENFKTLIAMKKTKKVCKNGHTFYKSSDCPTCPTCEKLKEPASGFLALLSNPARNALLHHGIDTLEKLSSHTEKEILKIHGIGKASLPIFRKSLEEKGLSFKDPE
jgi:DNA-directed RNA polymerase alpha subunit